MLELVKNSNSKCMNMEKLWRDWKNFTELDPREKKSTFVLVQFISLKSYLK